MADFSIPFAWKAIGLTFGLLSFIAGIGGSYIYTLKYGEDKCFLDTENKQLKADNKALNKTIEDIKNGFKNLQTREDEIRMQEGPNPDLGPAMRDELDRLQRDKSKSGNAF